MGNLFPGEYPDYRPMPKIAVKFLGKLVEVVPAALIVVSSCNLHEYEPAWLPHQQVMLPQASELSHQPEPTHREIDLIDGPIKSVVEALPPTADTMPPFNHTGNDVAIRENHQRRLWSSYYAPDPHSHWSPALWFATAQAAQSASR